MDRQTALLIALLLAAAVVRSLFRGDAGAGDGIRREQLPGVYWGLVSGGSAASLLFLTFAVQASG